MRIFRLALLCFAPFFSGAHAQAQNDPRNAQLFAPVQSRTILRIVTPGLSTTWTFPVVPLNVDSKRVGQLYAPPNSEVRIVGDSQAIQAYPAPYDAPTVTQTPRIMSGETLLRTVKALAESGHAGDPATVTSDLQLSFSGIEHFVSNGVGRGGCPAGGKQARYSYDVSDNASGVITTISKMHCDQANQNEATTTTKIVGNLDTCITPSRLQTIFPNLGSGDSFMNLRFLAGDQKSDFAFVIPGAEVNFWIEEAPLMFDYEYLDVRVPGESNEKPNLMATHHPPVCLAAMSLSSTSQLGSMHRNDFDYQPPTSTGTGIVSPSIGYQTQLANPGVFLLRAVKAVADSREIDDPNIVANLMHFALSPNNYSNSIATSCSAAPSFRNFVSIEYFMTDKSWFHALPTGKQVLKGGFALVSNSVVFTGIPMDDPVFNYSISGEIDCNKLSKGLVVGSIDFGNIPAFACISESQISSIFPSAHSVPVGGGLPEGYGSDEEADLRYSKTISVSDGDMLSDAIVNFEMTSSLPGGTQSHQPVCLNEIVIQGLYREGGVHKIDLGS